MSTPERVTPEMRSPNIETAATAYARAGIELLLVHGVEGERCACGKDDCKGPGKHPVAEYFPEGLNSSTRNFRRISLLLQQEKNVNVAIVPTGDLLVIDIDGPEGEKSIARYNLPPTAEVKTGRGRHLYYRAPGLKAWASPKLKGVDFRYARNGYVVAPPSLHRSGKRYVWVRGGGKIAQISVAIFGEKRRRTRETEIDRISEGGRNNFLASTAGFFRSKGLEADALATVLGSVNQAFCHPPLPSVEVERIATSIAGYEIGSSAFGDIADVEVEDVEWLLRPYFPIGAITMLDGDPGVGKSSLTVEMMASVSTGRGVPWADERPHGSVLAMSAEDDPARVFKPRLIASGADVSPGRIRFANDLFSLDEKGIEALRIEIAEHRPLLVVIDPIVAFIASGDDLHSAADMTRFLTRIDQLAREYRCTIIIVRHLRKSTEGNKLHRGLGSIALTGRVRSAVGVGVHPDDPDLRAMAHTKSNYSKLGATITYMLRSSGEVACVEWVGTDPDLTADQLFGSSGSGPGRPPTRSDAVRSFLEEFLARGPQKAVDVFRAAETRSFTKITVERTSRQMGVKKTRDGKASVWELSDEPEES